MATQQMLDLWRDVSWRFPGVTNMGIDNCRRIAGSSSWSQHAWGNALDIGVDRELGDRVYRYLVSNRTRLQLGTICWRNFGGCDPDAHQDHIHVEGLPKRRGTPPCAGGSGGSGLSTDSGVVGAVSTAIGSIPGLGVFLEPVFDRTIESGGDVGSALGGVLEPVQVLAGTAASLFQVETWLRVLWFIAGTAATIGAVVLFLRELGVSVPLPPQAQIARNLIGGR